MRRRAARVFRGGKQGNRGAVGALGSIQADFDHGVFITTSRFTKDAEESSCKKGAITILLLDGQAIADLMLDRGIGVVKQPVFLYEVAPDFFDFDGDGTG